MISSKDGFSILRNWKTFDTKLWFVRSGLGGPDVRVEDVLERRRVLKLRFENEEPFELDLRGVKFTEVSPEEIPFAHAPGQFVRFLELRSGDKWAYLFAEYSAAAAGELLQ
jgi:hypothetical protein